MDTLTHALSGALLACATAGRAAPPRSLPRRAAAGFLACAAPDLDFVFGFAGPAAYLLNHRGITHSVLLLPLWALGLSWLLAKLLREPGGWRALYGITALGIAAHIAGDVITSYGTMLLAPFSDRRVGIGTTFIIDLWFTGIIVAGLLGCAMRRGARILPAAALLLLVAYVGLQSMLKSRAEEFGAGYAASLGLRDARIDAQARPVSPFNWTVFVSDETAHRYAHVNLLRASPRAVAPEDGLIARLDAAYLPLAAARWETRSRFGDSPPEQAMAREVWALPELAFYRWFAAHPAFDGLSTGSTCVWFTDLRFLTPGREVMPFRYGACRASAGQAWRVHERRGDGSGRPLE